MSHLLVFIFTIFLSFSTYSAMADRGPAYKANTPGVSEQQKQSHYDLQTKMYAYEQKKERELRREIANLPDGTKQRAVLIAAVWLAELQLNLQSDQFQSRWADGVDAQQGTAKILMHYTMSLYALASDAQMTAAAECHSYEMARLRKKSLGEQLPPGRPCRENAYGEALIDETTAAGDRAVPPNVYETIDHWTKSVIAKSLAAIGVDGLFKIKAMPRLDK